MTDKAVAEDVGVRATTVCDWKRQPLFRDRMAERRATVMQDRAQAVREGMLRVAEASIPALLDIVNGEGEYKGRDGKFYPASDSAVARVGLAAVSTFVAQKTAVEHSGEVKQPTPVQVTVTPDMLAGIRDEG